MGYWVLIRLGISPPIRACQGNVVWGKESQKPAKELEAASICSYS